MQTFPLDRDGSFVWIADAAEWMQRASTAVAVDGGWLLVDPVDTPGLDRALATRPVIGVVQLLDRHRRDVDRLAERLPAPIMVPPVLAGGGRPLVVAGVEARTIPAVAGWREACLWLPERRLLVCADAIGSAAYYRARPRDPLGVHPLLRLRPPRAALALEPLAIACGHGPPVTAGAAPSLARALSGARRDLPRSWLGIAVRAVLRRH